MIATLWNLFFSFLKVGMLSFGGAYSLLPVIEREVVKNNHWLTPDEFMQTLSIVEFVPGAISIKFATYTGYKSAGILGAVAANLGNMLFPAMLMIGMFYTISHFGKHPQVMKAFSAIKYAIIGMIMVIMVQYLMKGQFQYKFIIFLLAGIVMTYLNIHPAFIVISVGLLALLI